MHKPKKTTLLKVGWSTTKYYGRLAIRLGGKLSALFLFLAYTDTEKSCEASLSVLYYIYFVRNVHFSTKNVDKYTLFMLVVHEKCGQVSEFYELSTENVDKLKTMEVIWVVNAFDCM